MTALGLTLPGLPPALADELRLDDDPRPSAVNVREALATYSKATSDYWAARELGDIVRTDPDERASGIRWKAATVDGARVLVAWQRARAELAHAVDIRRRALGGGRRGAE